MRVPGLERGRPQSSTIERGVHSRSHGQGTGNGLSARRGGAAPGGHQGNDEASGSTASGSLFANAAREPIGYWKDDQFVTVATPPNLGADIVRPKERELIDLIRSEKAKGRKVWVYVQYTDRHDVQGRLERILQEAKFQVG